VVIRENENDIGGLRCETLRGIHEESREDDDEDGWRRSCAFHGAD
jgi:hypothetical protein